MSFDPYAILGVARDIATESLKAAFKKRSKETHPDVNGTGDDAEFKLVTKAYGLLSDPDARAFYDQTGLAREASEQKMRDEMFILIKSTFDDTIQMFFDENKKLNNVEVLRFMRSGISAGIDRAMYQLDVVKSQLEELEKMAIDIASDRKQDNFFSVRIEELIVERKATMVTTATAHKCLVMALEELGKYRSSTEMMRNIFAEGWTTTSGSSPWR